MSEELRFELRLPAHPISVGVARGLVRSLAARLTAAHRERAELAVSELVTNSILHASRSLVDVVDVQLTLNGTRLTGVVSDNGPAFHVPTAPATPQIGGYGLHIVRRLTDVTISHTGAGNIITFTLDETSEHDTSSTG